jgi:threonyl-tRNA synthetase
MRHSAAHLMASAVLDIWPEAKFGVGPPIENGFYYDFELAIALTPKELDQIEQRMRALKNKKIPFERIEIPIDEAIDEMTKRRQPYKLELLKLLKEKGSTAVAKETGDLSLAASTTGSGGMATVSLYKTGEFLDLCRGPHVADTGDIGEFKLTRVSGAYWRGNEKNPQLQRVYAAAFNTKEELKHYLWQVEEAKKRDHRKLGKDLDIFIFSDDVGQGLPLWMPNGSILREELEKLAKEEEHRQGYQRVVTPHITKSALYYRSGHLPYYREDMYAPILIDDEEYFLKPMNCPHHHQIYLAHPRSYRELPLRYAEYGQVYRHEQSGVLSGLMRTRGFCQNDAHIYCRYDQAKSEFLNVMRLHAHYYEIMGINDYSMRFAKPDMARLDKYVDEPGKWVAAMELIREAMDESGYPYVEVDGEAAFYGPKIDFIIKNVLGNEYAISTNQLDFLASERFELTYIGEDGKEHPVYVIHRAPLGSHERFVAFLLEHYAGTFPTWLAPVQAVVIPVADRHSEYAHRLCSKLRASDVPSAFGGIRTEVDDSRESMQKKIRTAQIQKIPYMLVVGDRELAEGNASVRLRSGADLKSMSVGMLIDRVKNEVIRHKDMG